MAYETVIGLEVHVQLKTRTKAFCGCATEFGAPPNSQVCPVCLGFPGTLPVLNAAALDHAIKVGLALHCTVQEYTKFDRKHYYYPDLPKNYQISQYDMPVSKDGYLDIETDAGTKRIGIVRAHLEEDAGKLVHKEEGSLVDYNRTGIPLLEIVSAPDMRSPQEAYEYLTRLKSILEYLEVSDCDMEKGLLRCDANISIRPRGQTELGTKAELKNLNSFRAVRDALAFEEKRQAEVLDEGGRVVQETRLWDADTLTTVSMRSKEEAKDYRYFPEPDLAPCLISQEKIAGIRATLPELPDAKRARFVSQYGMLEADAAVLTQVKPDAEFSEECLRLFPGADKKPVVNWLTGAVRSLAAALGKERIGELGISAAGLVELAVAVRDGVISNLAGKEVLREMASSGKKPGEIIAEKNLGQISDSSSLDAFVAEAVAANPRSVQDFLSGKENALMFLVGQVMKRSQGKANPKVVQELLRKKLQGA